MPQAMFARAQAYSANKIASILAEADREPGFTSHIETVKPPVWRVGSKQAVEVAISQYMAQPAPVRLKTGRLVHRKRRADHRSLVAGVVSWPDATVDFRPGAVDRDELKFKFRAWLEKTEAWLVEQYGSNLIGVCVHADESHPHLHFFVVGDAQRLHPGLKSELVDNVRIEQPAARFEAHKAGLKLWLDDYYASVGQHFGMERTINAKPAWRIEDRATRAQLFVIDKQLRNYPDIYIQEQRDAVWDREEKTDRPQMRF